jgi:hypothetical protein
MPWKELLKFTILTFGVAITLLTVRRFHFILYSYSSQNFGDLSLGPVVRLLRLYSSVNVVSIM